MFRSSYMLLLFLCALSSAGQIEKQPVARYTFNRGTPEDEIGDNDAKPYNLVLTEDRFGNSNSAYFFRGNFDSYMSLGCSPILKPKSGSISIWFKIHQVIYNGKGSHGNGIIYTRAHPGPDFNEGFEIGYNFDLKKVGAALSCSELYQRVLYTERMSYLRVWYHVVLTYDDQHACLYVNGVLESKTSKNFETCFLEGDSVIVGCHNEKKNSRTFMGDIDDIEFYDTVLTPQEVFALYTAPNPNKTAILVKWVLTALAGILVIIALAFYIRYRIRRAVSIEKEKNQINARLLELEIRALRAQMNPHFIFNALNTLQRFVLEDRKEKTYEYLIEFSKLLRKMLESSESEIISLDEEIMILNSYLEVEKLRFDNSFEYRVRSDVAQADQVYIPIMLIQPFAENAVWHGLLNKKDKRFLTITFMDLDSKRLLCEIEDNGVGRNFKGQLNTGIRKKSLGLDLIRQRLELISNTNGIKTFFEFVDKTDPSGNSLGTLVRIILPKMS